MSCLEAPSGPFSPGSSPEQPFSVTAWDRCSSLYGFRTYRPQLSPGPGQRLTLFLLVWVLRRQMQCLCRTFRPCPSVCGTSRVSFVGVAALLQRVVPFPCLVSYLFWFSLVWTTPHVDSQARLEQSFGDCFLLGLIPRSCYTALTPLLQGLPHFSRASHPACVLSKTRRAGASLACGPQARAFCSIGAGERWSCADVSPFDGGRSRRVGLFCVSAPWTGSRCLAAERKLHPRRRSHSFCGSFCLALRSAGDAATRGESRGVLSHRPETRLPSCRLFRLPLFRRLRPPGHRRSSQFSGWDRRLRLCRSSSLRSTVSQTCSRAAAEAAGESEECALPCLLASWLTRLKTRAGLGCCSAHFGTRGE